MPVTARTLPLRLTVPRSYDLHLLLVMLHASKRLSGTNFSPGQLAHILVLDLIPLCAITLFPER
jgi:hypothetical protein